MGYGLPRPGLAHDTIFGLRDAASYRKRCAVIPATAPKTKAARHPFFAGAVEAGWAWSAATGFVSRPARAFANSAAVAYLSAGSFARARTIAASTCSAIWTIGRRGRGGPRNRRINVACGFGPL